MWALFAATWLASTAARGESINLPVPLDTILAPLRDACPGCADAAHAPVGRRCELDALLVSQVRARVAARDRPLNG